VIKMSGSIILTTVGRDEIAKYLVGEVSGKIHKFRLGEGGFLKSTLVEDVIEASATGLEYHYTYTVTGGDFDITDVTIGTDTFKVAGDKTEFFVTGAQARVIGSTGNDGNYTVASSSFAAGETSIVVDEDVTDATVDGKIFIDRLPILKGPSIDSYHHPMKVVEYNGVTPVQTIEDTTGTGDLTGDGTATINYKYGTLDINFAVNVTAGNSVVVEYKYANTPIAPDASKTMLDSQSATGLFTFEKEFIPADFTFRGVGLGTERVKCFLTSSEGIDDGDSYGGTPYFFEGGVFDEDDVMLCYFTFDKERKRGSTTITHNVDFIV